jgi:hypothetical protein
VTEQTPRIEWQPHAEVGRLRGFRDDPGRIVLLFAAVLLLAGAFLPWAEGKDPIQRPIVYTAQMAFAEGFILLVLAGIIAIMAGTHALVETTSRTVFLLPLALAVVAVAMWIGADRESMIFIDDWVEGGGSGTQTAIKFVTAIGIALIPIGLFWIERTRPADVKAATRGLREEWKISRLGAAEAAVAAVFAIVCAAIAGVVTVFVVGPDGAFFAVFTSLLGMGFGISLGIGLMRWFRGGEERAATEPARTRPDIEVAKVVRKRP